MIRALTVVIALTTVVASGCVASSSDDLCQAAAAHLAACLGEDPPASVGQCDGTTAEAVLAADCDGLLALDGAADGFGCLLGGCEDEGPTAGRVSTWEVLVDSLRVSAFRADGARWDEEDRECDSRDPDPYVRVGLGGASWSTRTERDRTAASFEQVVGRAPVDELAGVSLDVTVYDEDGGCGWFADRYGTPMASCQVRVPESLARDAAAGATEVVLDVADCGAEGIVTDLRLRLIRLMSVDVTVTSAILSDEVVDANDLGSSLPDPVVALSLGDDWDRELTECAYDTREPAFEGSPVLTARLSDLVIKGLTIRVSDGGLGGFPPVPCGILTDVATCTAEVGGDALPAELVVGCGPRAPEVRLRLAASAE